MLVTQNVDDLHERAGSHGVVVHMHGELLSARCLACRRAHEWREDLGHGPACPHCGEAKLRPDIVWFGEIPYHMERIEHALRACDLFVAIGTSGVVYPAAGFVAVAADAGARTVELNLKASGVTWLFDEVHEGPATVTVPQWVEQILA